jgi:uncharacterized Zn-binding protein involved in type VI secretion
MPPAARRTDPVVATDTHIVAVPAPTGAVPTPLPHPFSGTLQTDVSTDVLINQLGAATVGSVAVNQPPHLPTPPGTSFLRPPSNRGTVQTGSPTVQINGKDAARLGDPVRTCNDPVDLPVGTIIGGSLDVQIGSGSP